MLLLIMAASAMQPEGVKPDCSGSTVEMNACMGLMVDRSKKRLDDYLQAAIDRHTEKDGKSDSVAYGIRASQTAFEAYRDIECGAVLEEWKEGTIRGVMTLSCELQLTDERTHTVWSNWLQYMDSTPPIRPEPKPTED